MWSFISFVFFYITHLCFSSFSSIWLLWLMILRVLPCTCVVSGRIFKSRSSLEISSWRNLYRNAVAVSRPFPSEAERLDLDIRSHTGGMFLSLVSSISLWEKQRPSNFEIHMWAFLGPTSIQDKLHRRIKLPFAPVIHGYLLPKSHVLAALS